MSDSESDTVVGFKFMERLSQRLKSMAEKVCVIIGRHVDFMPLNVLLPAPRYCSSLQVHAQKSPMSDVKVC